ncbi:MAG TPA: hypothetical protein DHN33_07535 [Eubacteriaceae bacterium]|nr:hypothetical protein [Eubacteriaceae bacterium]
MSLVGKKYAQALFEVAKEEDKVDAYYQQMTMINGQLKENEDFFEILLLPSVEVKEKKEMLRKVFEPTLDREILQFLILLLDKRRFIDFELIYLEFKTLFLEENKQLEATIVSVLPLEEKEINQLKKNLESRYQKTITIENKIDPALIGGVVVYVGEQVIDGSVKRKLTTMRNELREVRLQQLGVN